MSKEFEAYLAKHGLEPEDGVKFVDSSFEEGKSSSIREEGEGDVLNASYSEEVRRLLRGESSDLMSTSMQVIAKLLLKETPSNYILKSGDIGRWVARFSLDNLSGKVVRQKLRFDNHTDCTLQRSAGGKSRQHCCFIEQ